MTKPGANAFTKLPSRSNAVRTRCSVSLLAGPRYMRGVWEAQTMATDMIGFLRTPNEYGPPDVRGLFLHKRTLAFGKGTVDRLARQRLHDVVEIPVALILSGLLHLEQVHVVDHLAVGADVAVAREEVVHPLVFHLLHDDRRIVRARRLDGFEIVRDRRIDSAMKAGRHDLGFSIEALSPCARLRRTVPVEGRHLVSVVRDLQSDRTHIGQYGLQRNDLGFRAQPEFVGLLQRSHRITA